MLNKYFVFANFLLYLICSQMTFAQTCANPGQDGDLTISSEVIVNTYYPPLNSVTAGATSAFVDSPVGASTTDDITAGDLILFIQMQDATIDSSNNDSYGDGVAGGVASGTTSEGNTGLHEFVVATSSINAVTGEFSFSSTGGGGDGSVTGSWATASPVAHNSPMDSAKEAAATRSPVRGRTRSTSVLRRARTRASSWVVVVMART